eukprot:gene28354-37415_t
MSKHFYYHLTICIAATCLCLSPLFISELQPRIRSISQTGSLGDILRSSVTIKVSEGITIGSTLPVMMDIFLDKIENISVLNLTNTFIAIFVIITSGTLYLSLNDRYFMTYLYISLYGFRMVSITSAILYSISKGVIATRWKMNPWIFLWPIISLASSNILLSLNLLFPEYGAIPILLSMTRLAATIALFVMHGYWFFNLWRNYRTHKQLDLDEKKEMTYMVGELRGRKYFDHGLRDDSVLFRVHDCVARPTAAEDTSRVAGLLREGGLNPVDNVEGDDSLDKKVNGYLRVEVVDSGAAFPLCWRGQGLHFHHRPPYLLEKDGVNFRFHTR